MGEVIRWQPEKAPSPMLVTLLGIVIEVRPLQFLKAQTPIVVTLWEIVTEVRPLHSRKAPSPILVTGKFITL